jgi:hypothetical protein
MIVKTQRQTVYCECCFRRPGSVEMRAGLAFIEPGKLIIERKDHGQTHRITLTLDEIRDLLS